MYSEQQGNSIEILQLEGSCTVDRAKQIMDKFSSTLKTADNLPLDLSRITAMDSTFFQILCSLQKSLSSRDKSIYFSTSPAAVIKDYLQQAGLAPACCRCPLNCPVKAYTGNGI